MNRAERRRQQRALGADPRLQGMEVRYGGRTLEIRAVINTDREPMAIVEAVKAAARGPKLDMVVVTAGEVEAEAAANLWDAVMRASEDYVKREGKA